MCPTCPGFGAPPLALARGVRSRYPVGPAPGWLADSTNHVRQFLGEIRLLRQQFAFERVALLTSHPRNVEPVIGGSDIFHGLFGPAMHPRDPGVGSTVGAVWIIRADPDR